MAGRVLMGGVQVGGLDVQRHPPAPGVVGDGGEADLGPAFGEHAPQPAGVVMHPDLPDAGQRDRAGAVVVADADRRRTSLGCLLRSRNDGTATGFLLEAGKAHSLAFALAGSGVRPGFEPLTQIDRGFLEYLLAHLGRHAKPVTTVSATPSVSTVNTRPASSVFFQALNALIRSNPVHGTSASGSVLRWVSAVFTIRRHWLNANLDAPACRASTSCCSTVGSRQNLNVVCRLISPVSIPQPTDNHPDLR